MNLLRNLTSVVLGLSLSCAAIAHEPTPGAETKESEAPGAEAARAPLDKGQLAKAVRLVDEAEMDLARLALERSQDESVRQYAQRMLDEHGALDERLKTAVTMSRTAERDSDYGARLTGEAKALRERLSGMQGLEFDRAYIDSQVDLHRDALEVLDAHLGSPEMADADIGASDDVAKTEDGAGDGVRDVAMDVPAGREARGAGRVRPIFQDARTMFDHHLTEAERIQGSLRTRDDAAPPAPETKGVEAPGG